MVSSATRVVACDENAQIVHRTDAGMELSPSPSAPLEATITPRSDGLRSCTNTVSKGLARPLRDCRPGTRHGAAVPADHRFESEPSPDPASPMHLLVSRFAGRAKKMSVMSFLSPAQIRADDSNAT